MVEREQKNIYARMIHNRTYGFWRSAAQCLLGAVVLALLTYVCFRLQTNSTTVAILYLIVAVHSEDLARFLDEWRTALADGEPLETEARLRRADGEYRWLLIRAVPLRDDTGKIVKWYGASADIEDRKRAEETLRKAHAELAHVTRVTTMGELTASIAHEVNQPLSAIVNNSSVCLRWLNGAAPNLDEAREAARRIVRDGTRAGEVIDHDLLDAISKAIEQDRAARRQHAEMAVLRDRYESLTPREREMMGLVVSGLLNKQAAAELGINEGAVKVHRGQVTQKMQAESLADLVRMSEKLGIPRATNL